MEIFDMEFVDFFKKCSAADWFYEYSDDMRVRNSGRSAIAHLSYEAGEHPTKLKMFQDWQEYIRSCQRNDDTLPRPELTDYI
jgi:hypothetical protein